MRNIILVFTVFIAMYSCKNKTESKESPEEVVRGEFILIDGAAVIKGKDFIYGVEINELSKKLAAQVKPLQREEYDMVPVVVNAVIKPNPEEGWEKILDIKEIIGVTPPTSKLPTVISSDQAVDENLNEVGGHSHDGHSHEGHSH